MSATERVFITLKSETCCNCGVVFGIESGHMERLRENREWFYCPNGHRQHYVGQTEKERRIAELERNATALKNSRDFWSERYSAANASLARENRRVNGYKGVVTRMKRRTVKGMCPCCSHKFADVEKHMKARHPGWNPDRHAEKLAEESR